MWRTLTAAAFLMYVNKRSEAAFLDGLGLVLATHLMGLTGFRAATWGSPEPSREATAEVGEVQTMALVASHFWG